MTNFCVYFMFNRTFSFLDFSFKKRLNFRNNIAKSQMNLTI